jgi:hypothetical protein
VIASKHGEVAWAIVLGPLLAKGQRRCQQLPYRRAGTLVHDGGRGESRQLAALCCRTAATDLRADPAVGVGLSTVVGAAIAGAPAEGSPSAATVSAPVCSAGSPGLRALDRLRRADVSISGVPVQTADEALAARFAGSPTILIDGRDLFPTSTEWAGGLACRLYRTPAGFAGVPRAVDIMSALSERV